MTTYSALYYHIVWATKERQPVIPEIIECKLYAYISGIIQKSNGTALQIGGMPDHVHMLVKLKPDQHIPDLVKTIKTASGAWIREAMPVLNQFHWQNGYGVFSVSQSNVDVVRQYIIHQKKHHERRGFDDEWVGFLKKHNIEYNEKYVFG